MRSLLRWAGLTAMFALTLPLFAADEKEDAKKKKAKEPAKKAKKPAKKKAEANDEPKEKPEKVVYGKAFLATLTQVASNSQKDFAVEISYVYRELNSGALASLAQLQQQQRQALLNRNFQQRQQQLAQIAQQMQQVQRTLYQLKEAKQKVELRATDDMKIRTLLPPPEYDDNGALKKYTAKELRKLKGPGNLPGYPGDWESLRANAVVKIYLAKKQEVPKKEPAKKEKGEDGGDDMEATRLEVVMVVVVRDPPQPRDQ
jgi:DNA-binding protein H-NS